MKINSKTRKILTFCFVIACYIGLYFISQSHFEKLNSVNVFKFFCNSNYQILIVCFLLVFLNWFLEAIKWKISLSPIENISLKTSVLGVLKGIPVSLFTPNRLGEAFGRPTVLKSENKISGAFATAYCGLSQMPLMMLCGCAACLYFKISDKIFFMADFLTSGAFIMIGFFFTAIIFLCYFFPEFLIPFLKKRQNSGTFLSKLYFFSQYSLKEKFFLMFFSFLRYLVYSFQNYFAINAFGLEIIFPEGLAAVFLIYALMSFVPRPALLELGVRCSASVVVLTCYTSDFTIPTLSSVFIWCINLLFPALFGTLLYLFEKKMKKT